MSVNHSSRSGGLIGKCIGKVANLIEQIRRKKNGIACIALAQIFETVVIFHFSGGKVYSLNKGCHTCIVIKQCMCNNCTVQYTVELQWLEHCWLVYHGCFELVLQSLGKKSLGCRFGII